MLLLLVAVVAGGGAEGTVGQRKGDAEAVREGIEMFAHKGSCVFGEGAPGVGGDDVDDVAHGVENLGFEGLDVLRDGDEVSGCGAAARFGVVILVAIVGASGCGVWIEG